MKIIAKIINILISIFLVSNIILLFIVNINLFGLGMVKCNTNELSPRIKQNDLIIYQKKATYFNEDIILYSIDNKYSLAIIKQKEEYISYIKDNSSKNYNPISNADIKGSPVWIISPVAITIYLIIIIFFYLLYTILINAKNLNKKEQK